MLLFVNLNKLFTLYFNDSKINFNKTLIYNLFKITLCFNIIEIYLYYNKKINIYY